MEEHVYNIRGHSLTTSMVSDEQPTKLAVLGRDPEEIRRIIDYITENQDNCRGSNDKKWISSGAIRKRFGLKRDEYETICVMAMPAMKWNGKCRGMRESARQKFAALKHRIEFLENKFAEFKHRIEFLENICKEHGIDTEEGEENGGAEETNSTLLEGQ